MFWVLTALLNLSPYIPWAPVSGSASFLPSISSSPLKLIAMSFTFIALHYRPNAPWSVELHRLLPDKMIKLMWLMFLEEPLKECLNLRNTAAVEAAVYVFDILSGHHRLPGAECKCVFNWRLKDETKNYLPEVPVILSCLPIYIEKRKIKIRKNV